MKKFKIRSRLVVASIRTSVKFNGIDVLRDIKDILGDAVNPADIKRFLDFYTRSSQPTPVDTPKEMFTITGATDDQRSRWYQVFEFAALVHANAQFKAA